MNEFYEYELFSKLEETNMDAIIYQLAIPLIILAVVYFVAVAVPFFTPFSRVIQIICAAIGAIIVLKFLAGFI